MVVLLMRPRCGESVTEALVHWVHDARFRRRPGGMGYDWGQRTDRCALGDAGG